MQIKTNSTKPKGRLLYRAWPAQSFRMILITLTLGLTMLTWGFAPQVASAQSPTDPIDQRQEEDGSYVSLANGLELLAAAQFFVPTVDNLTRIEFKKDSIYGGQVNVRIHESTLDGPVVAQQQLPFRNGPRWESIAFVPVQLIPGNTYVIKIRVIYVKPDGIGDFLIGHSNGAVDEYASGTAWILNENNTWVPLSSNQDLAFRTYYDPDFDNDGIPIPNDNCLSDANPGQENFDGDAQGDVCDPDDDNDGVVDDGDAFPFDASESSDNDSDGIGDNADPDDDNDGQSDLEEEACGSDPLDAGSVCATPAFTCGGYDVFEETPGNYSAPDFAGTLIVGTNRRDHIVGTVGDDLILGLNGGDKIFGKQGNDVICGGRGHDWIHGHAGNDIIFGEQGWDDLIGHLGEDELDGGAGYDVLLGGRDNDILRGGNNRDDLYGQHGDDDLDGGNGNDFCRGQAGSDTLSNCEGASAASMEDASSVDLTADGSLSSSEQALLDKNNMAPQLFLPLITRN